MGDTSVDAVEGVPTVMDGFMVPMRVQMRKEAFHELDSIRSGPAATDFRGSPP